MPVGAEMLVALTIGALREHPPFDEMDGDSLRFLAERLSIGYYPRGEAIVTPAGGNVDRFFIVKQGRVRGSGSLAGAPSADLVLGAGECFPMSALVGRRAVVYTYSAGEDTFCWELPAADFHALLERSAQFQAFCTSRLAKLVERSHRALRAEAGASLIDGTGMLAPLRTSSAWKSAAGSSQQNTSCSAE